MKQKENEITLRYLLGAFFDNKIRYSNKRIKSLPLDGTDIAFYRGYKRGLIDSKNMLDSMSKRSWWERLRLRRER